MAPFRTLTVLFIPTFTVGTDARCIYADHLGVANRDDVRRQLGPITADLPSHIQDIAAPVETVLTHIIPSPGAPPIPVTEQSQLVTSFVPQYTVCELLRFQRPSVTPLPPAQPTSAPYLNQSTALPNRRDLPTPEFPGTCTTIYSPTVTPICATTLQGLYTHFPVSACSESLTFSSAYGYSIYPQPSYPLGSSPAPNSSLLLPRSPSDPSPSLPTIATVTSFFLAPWQSLTAGTVPSDVRVHVCSTLPVPGCAEELEAWTTATSEVTDTSTRTVVVSTTVPGPGRILIGTWSADVTGKITTLEFSSEVVWTTVRETEGISRMKDARETGSGPMVTRTRAPDLTTVTVESVRGTVGISEGRDLTTTVLVTTTRTTTSTTTVYPMVTEAVEGRGP